MASAGVDPAYRIRAASPLQLASSGQHQGSCDPTAACAGATQRPSTVLRTWGRPCSRGPDRKTGWGNGSGDPPHVGKLVRGRPVRGNGLCVSRRLD